MRNAVGAPSRSVITGQGPSAEPASNDTTQRHQEPFRPTNHHRHLKQVPVARCQVPGVSGAGCPVPGASCPFRRRDSMRNAVGTPSRSVSTEQGPSAEPASNDTTRRHQEPFNPTNHHRHLKQVPVARCQVPGVSGAGCPVPVASCQLPVDRSGDGTACGMPWALPAGQ